MTYDELTVNLPQEIEQAFSQWYKQNYPDEYHDPPSDFPGMGGGWGGARQRPPGSLPPGPKPLNPNGAQVKLTVRLDPDVLRRLREYAATQGNFTQALNKLLDEILEEKKS